MKIKFLLLIPFLSLNTVFGAVAVNTGADQDRLSGVVSGGITSTNKATYTMWVYNGAGSPPTYMAILESRTVSLQGILLNDAAPPRLNCAWTGNEYSLDSGLFLPLNEWTFVTCQINGTSRRSALYKRSGELIKEYVYTHTDTTQDINGTYIFGQDPAVPGSREFAGWFGETRIYGRALSNQEIEALAKGLSSRVSTEGICAWWRMDENTVGDIECTGCIRDWSGKSNELSAIVGSTPPVWVHSNPINYE